MTEIPTILARAEQWLDERQGLGPEMADRIYDLAEPGLCEAESAKTLYSRLEEAGFEIEVGAGGLPTQFVARWGDSGPTIGFMTECDATPGESQAPVPRPEPVIQDGPGFTDLHNGIGAASVVAALATRQALVDTGTPGRIVVFGSAAEKLCIGKPFLARDGYFEGLDAVVAWHPRFYSTVEWDAGPGPVQTEAYEFHGTSTYGARPWSGKSALDALTLMNVTLQFQREHIPPRYAASISEFITRGGLHPTSLPASARGWFTQRANSLEGIEHLSTLLQRAATGAATALDMTFSRNVMSATRPWLPNHTIARLAYRNLERAGAPQFPYEMHDFANAVLAELGQEPREEPFDRSLTPPESGITAEFRGGADDVNEFGWHAPTTRIYVAYGVGDNSLPNWALGAFARTGVAHATVNTAARAMAYTASELFTNPEELAAAQAEHHRRLEEVGYIEPRIPEDSFAPVGDHSPPFVRDHLLRTRLPDALTGA